MNPIVVIPARLAATRLPDKPLAEIGGVPMIVQVWRRAVEAGVGPVLVACAEPAIAEAVEGHGGRAVLTDPALPSGSDRVCRAVEIADPEGAHDVVVNLQGDLPTLDPESLRAVLTPLDNPEVDIATLVAPISDPAERDDPNVVKAAVAFAEGAATARALYFSRCPVPWDGGDPARRRNPLANQATMNIAAFKVDPNKTTSSKPLYHHIGVYAFRRAALHRFVELPPGLLEQRERLEQLRALEAGLRIDVARVDTVPLGVDTPADLARARDILGTAAR